MTAWRSSVCVGLAAAAGIVLLPSGLGRDVVFTVIGTVGIVALMVGIRRNRPTNRHAWYLIAAGGSLWVTGDTVYSWYQDILHSDPFPSLADVFYLSAYPLLILGLLALVRSRDPRRSVTAFIDSAMLTIGVALCSWVYLVAPTWADADAGQLARVVGVAYPLGDILLLAVLLRLATGRGAWSTATRLLATSFVLLIVADSLFEASVFVPFLDTHVELLDPLWLAVYVLWGAVALHPSMRTLSLPAPARTEPMQVRRLVILATMAMVNPAVLVIQLLTGKPLHVWAVVIVSSAMVLLLLVRMVLMVRRLQTQADDLNRLADSDYLTGLANRRRFADRLGEQCTVLFDDPPGATPHRSSGAPSAGCAVPPEPSVGALLVLLDLERFTEINESLGHHTGDLILRAVADRLTGLAGAHGLAARLGGDTFGILDPSVTTVPGAHAAAAALRDALEQPYELPDLMVTVEVSMGFLLVPDDCAEHSTSIAMHRLDVALAAAKSRPGRTAHYSSEMESGGLLGPLLIGELSAALERSELILNYQPQVETESGRVIGVEALVRWQHPTRGLLGPDTFIAAAEQTGLIGPLTQYVLDHALTQCAAWQRTGLHLTVAVNLSVRNLLDPGLVDDVRDALHRHGLSPDVLELEITESSAMIDPRRSMQVLGELAGMGITLSIDDFGTGHSSLAYLQKLPVRRLKIDRSFVAGVLTDPASAAIVSSTIELARHLHLEVVAEGVEDDETLLSLRDMRCWAVQGFGLGRPVLGSLVAPLVEQIELRVPNVLGVPRPYKPLRAVGPADAPALPLTRREPA